ncbi:MAG: type II toxin-antitoxin system prevent-host-death family antitoxin [Verrucomicrobiota bacterium]
MHTVSLFEAKTHLSGIVEALLSGKENEVIISRRGKPVVRLMPLEQPDTSVRIGVARGRFAVPDNIDTANETIAGLFNGGELEK